MYHLGSGFQFMSWNPGQSIQIKQEFEGGYSRMGVTAEDALKVPDALYLPAPKLLV